MSSDKRVVIGNGPGGKLEQALARNGGSLEDIEWLSTGDNFKKVILLRTGQQADLVTDNLIHVDRSVRPNYPDWVDKVMHPELENTGPAEYDATQLIAELVPEQENVIGGKKVYKYLKDNNLLETCVGLADLVEIQKKGIEFFRQNWKGKVVFGWRFVVRSRDGSLNVPCLYESGGEVVLNWSWVDNNWNANCPALRFAS